MVASSKQGVPITADDLVNFLTLRSHTETDTDYYCDLGRWRCSDSSP